MGQEEIQLQVRCRDGPLKERRCTDWFCCFLYLVIVASVIFLAIFAGDAGKMSKKQIETALRGQDGFNPLLAISQSMTYIIISVASAAALCVVVVVITFIIPAISAYILMPLMLLLMLLLGSSFLYRYFGNKLPFINKNIQDKYAGDHTFVSLIVGIGFLVGFLVAMIVLCAKQSRFRFIVSSLQLAKKCFWDNAYCFICSFIFSGISLLALYFNLLFLEIASLQSKGQHFVTQEFFVCLILVEMAWTHGYLQAYSDYFFQSIAMHWYYSKKYQGEHYSGCTHVLSPTLKNSITNIGSIMYGWILSFIPQSFVTMINSCEQKTQVCHKICCGWQRCGCDALSKYCYIGTIMYGYPFCKASQSSKNIRGNAKHTFPELYMVGNFYITIAKIFILMTSLIICYFLIANNHEHAHNVVNIIAPILAALLPTLEIATHFMNSTGLVGDTIYLAYVIDFNCQTSNFGKLKAQHCPQQAEQIIHDAKINRFADYG